MFKSHLKFPEKNAPVFTVAISTYKRDARIAPTLESVANQTFSDFEALIISDGPASKGLKNTVKEFDSRFKLHELPFRTGSQSAPNNLARSKAKGRYLSYLGHDDIWHPDHLNFINSVAQIHPRADFVVSGCLMIGPDGMDKELTWVSGIFDEFGPEPGLKNFYPPSSVTHKINASAQLPLWPDAMKISAPVDSAFMKASAELGLNFVSTKEVTVFKFNSAFRYMSYLLPEDHEQRGILDLFRNTDEISIYIEEKVAQTKAQGTYMHLRHPNPEEFEIGEISEKHKAIRGANEKVAQKLLQTVNLNLKDEILGFDWHQLEGEDGQTWRWSGPSTKPKVALYYVSKKPVLISLRIKDFITDDVKDSLKIFLNSEQLDFNLIPRTLGKPWKVQALARLTRREGSVLSIHMDAVHAPNQIDPESLDVRKLGICLEGIDLIPQGGYRIRLS